MTSKACVGVVACSIAIVTAWGCVSSSTRSDLKDVRALSQAEALPSLPEDDDDEDPLDASETRALLREPLDAERAVRVAILHNRELRASLRELGIARGQVMQAGLLSNPRVEVELPAEREVELELRLELDLTDSLFAPFRSRAHAPLIEAARYRAAGQVVALGYRVRAAFYAALAAEQQARIAAHDLEGADARREAARALRDAGNVSELVAVSEEVAYERARVRLTQLELETASKRETLARELGVEGPFTLVHELPALPAEPNVPDGLAQRALRTSLELRETEQRIEALGRRAGLARTEGLVPDIGASVTGQLADNDEDPSGDDEWGIGVGVSVGIPLFDRSQGTVVALEAELNALRERYLAIAADVRSRVRQAERRARSSFARAQSYEKVILPAQRKVTEQTLLQYNAMQIGVFQLVQAKRDELDLDLARVETLREHHTAAAELAALLAGARVQETASGATASPTSTDSGASSSEGGH